MELISSGQWGYLVDLTWCIYVQRFHPVLHLKICLSITYGHKNGWCPFHPLIVSLAPQNVSVWWIPLTCIAVSYFMVLTKLCLGIFVNQQSTWFKHILFFNSTWAMCICSMNCLYYKGYYNVCCLNLAWSILAEMWW